MRAILFHGTGSSPDSYWFPYIKANLEERGYKVIAPMLPNADAPTLDSWLSAVVQQTYDEDTILIGHSSGAALMLEILETIPSVINQAILVAGFYKPLEVGKPEPMVKAGYDWEKIRSHAQSFVFINSNNDPWGCTDAMGREMLNKLGGVLVVPKDQGHMGSTTFSQPYTEFPLLLKLIN